MNKNGDQSRAIFAVVLSGVILVGWNYLFGTKQSSQVLPYVPNEEQRVVQQDERKAKKIEIVKQKEQEKIRIFREYKIFKGQNSYVIDDGLNVLDGETQLATESIVNVTGSAKPIELFFQKNGRYVKPHFQLRRESNARLVGRDLDMDMSVTLEVLDSGKLYVALDFGVPVKPRLVFNKQMVTSNNSGSALGSFSASGSYAAVDRFVFFEKDTIGIHVGEREEADIQLKWLGLDTKYHLLAYVFFQKHSVHYQTTEGGQLFVNFNQEIKTLEGSIAYAKKYYYNLKSLGDNLSNGIDFGFFAIVAEPLLKALIAIKGFFPNWGVAIILLTLIIRLLTFPLYYKQMKSMNKMKKVQPKLQELKEKYKGDTRRQQVETMALFKKEGVNPMGGCLPLFLQMPIFIAFYKVLTISAELDNQPFVGWIDSLTEKDPYYILPVLVTLLMWLNQKIMPSTIADPTQQKIMNFIPFVFGFIFLNMPAGLNLYILVSTTFGILQQIFVNKRMETA